MSKKEVITIVAAETGLARHFHIWNIVSVEMHPNNMLYIETVNDSTPFTLSGFDAQMFIDQYNEWLMESIDGES